MSTPFAVLAVKEKPPALSDELSALLSDKFTFLISPNASLTEISHFAHFVDQNDPNPRLTQMVASAILAVWWDLFGIPNQFEYNDNIKDIAVKPFRLVSLNTVLQSVARQVPNCGDYQHQQSVAAKLAEIIINNIRRMGCHGVSLVSFSDTVVFNTKSIHVNSFKIEEIENTDCWYFMVMAP